jgi:hypothetical protein
MSADWSTGRAPKRVTRPLVLQCLSRSGILRRLSRPLLSQVLDRFFQDGDQRLGVPRRERRTENLQNCTAIMRPHPFAQSRAAATILRRALALKQTFRFEPIYQTSDVVRLDRNALAELADAQPSARTPKLEQHVIPCQGWFARGAQPLFDSAQRQRMSAEEMAPGAYRGVMGLRAKGVAFSDEPKSIGPTKFADFDDTCGNLIRLVEG